MNDCDDEQIKFLSILFYPDEPHQAALSHPAAQQAQIVLRQFGTPGESMELQVVTDTSAGPEPAAVSAPASPSAWPPTRPTSP
ncbi:hypothetical protein [Kineosporia babensis]|uniref:Uncharacterized protein n=1 Tax=Kineosporia babensis TaxID=499548 RepID=A0A9X1STX0_9ACTN|nr:hypothetical protein [Kineosporia babensis]MCD5311035.1 hypothetical protein [Kineosporia babensis]